VSCPKCATKLAAPLSVSDERKVVTTLFCDLVAFTAMSEGAEVIRISWSRPLVRNGRAAPARYSEGWEGPCG